MDLFQIDAFSKETVMQSFGTIARLLFSDYLLQVNEAYYRLIDIEFYYDTKEENTHQDVYTHGHITQLQSGKWYFHDSGIDITIGNGVNHRGGILIRAVAKVDRTKTAMSCLAEAVHGPLRVRDEICKNFNGVLCDSPNVFRLLEISKQQKEAFMPAPSHIVKTKRVNLTLRKNDMDGFLESKYRFVMLLDKCQFKHVSKTIIANDLKEQQALTNEQVNALLGSKFL